MRVDIQMKAGNIKSVRKSEAKVLVLIGRAQYLTRDMQAAVPQVAATSVDAPTKVEPKEPKPKPKRKYERKPKVEPKE